MSIAAQLVRAAIEAGSIGVIRDVREEHLLEDEAPLIRAVRAHINRYSQLPDINTLREQGFQIVRGRNESPLFYLDKIRERHTYNQLSAQQPRYVAAMRGDGHGGVPQTALAVQIMRDTLLSVGNTMSPNQYSTLTQQAGLVLEDLDYAKQHPGLRGVTLAWPTLNDKTLGAQGGDLIVIVGRPSKGKSYLLLECAHDAWQCGHSSIFISMEMTLLQIARRWLGRTTGINPRLIHQGHLSGWAESHLRHTVRNITEGSAPVHFLAGDMEKQVDGIEAMAQEFCPDIIYIDAAYLLEPSLRGKSSAAKWEQLSQVIKELKKLAQRINRAIVITVQFNRNVANNSTKELDMKDIGGTDSIPQDASIVVGVRSGPAPYQKTKRILDMMKNREGEVASFATNFRFEPVDMSECPLEESIEEGGTVNAEWMV